METEKHETIKKIVDSIDFVESGITTVVETGAGYEMSYYISTQYTGLKYVLNDNHHVLKYMKNIMRDEGIKTYEYNFKREEYDYIYKWLIGYGFIKEGESRTELTTWLMYDFLINNDVEIINDDYENVYNKYKDDENAFIFTNPKTYTYTQDAKKEKAKICLLLDNEQFHRILYK